MLPRTSRQFPRLAALALAGSALVLGGCSAKVTRSVDVSKGEYYSADEVKNLKKDKYQSYCAELDAELKQLQAATASAKAEADQNHARVAAVQGELRDLETRYNAEKAEADKVQEQVAYFEGLPKTWTVRKGEYLHKISGYEEVYADPLKWPRLYRANRTKIADPNVIQAGWVLTVPRDWPHQWTVASGEYLSRISGYWEVYNRSSLWPRLYEANKDQIKDADVLSPGWVLTIPRADVDSHVTNMEGK